MPDTKEHTPHDSTYIKDIDKQTESVVRDLRIALSFGMGAGAQVLCCQLPSEYSVQTGDRSACSPEKRGLKSKTGACDLTMQGCAEQSRVWGDRGRRPPYKPVCCPSTVAPHPGSDSLLSENYGLRSQPQVSLIPGGGWDIRGQT